MDESRLNNECIIYYYSWYYDACLMVLYRQICIQPWIHTHTHSVAGFFEGYIMGSYATLCFHVAWWGVYSEGRRTPSLDGWCDISGWFPRCCMFLGWGWGYIQGIYYSSVVTPPWGPLDSFPLFYCVEISFWLTLCFPIYGHLLSSVWRGVSPAF